MSTEATLSLCRAVREAAEKATKAPWRLKPDDISEDGQYHEPCITAESDSGDECTVATVRVGLQRTEANGKFMALTRTAAPLLAELVEALLAEREARDRRDEDTTTVTRRGWPDDYVAYQDAVRQHNKATAHVAELLQKAGELCPSTPNPH